MIFMSPPKIDSYQGSVMLCCRIVASSGRDELMKFAKKCGFDNPVFTRKDRYDEHIKVSGRRVVEIVREKGAIEIPSQKSFRKILTERRPVDREQA